MLCTFPPSCLLKIIRVDILIISILRSDGQFHSCNVHLVSATNPTIIITVNETPTLRTKELKGKGVSYLITGEFIGRTNKKEGS